MNKDTANAQTQEFPTQVGLNEIIKHLDSIKQQQHQQEQNLAFLSQQANSMMYETQKQNIPKMSMDAQRKSVDRLNRGFKDEPMKIYQKMDVQSFERSNGNKSSFDKSNERLQQIQPKSAQKQQLTPIYSTNQFNDLPAKKIKHKKRNSKGPKSQLKSILNTDPNQRSRNSGTPNSYFQSRIQEYSTTLQKSLNKPNRSGKLSPTLKQSQSPLQKFQTLPSPPISNVQQQKVQPLLIQEHNTNRSPAHNQSIESQSNLNTAKLNTSSPLEGHNVLAKRHDTQPLISMRDFDTTEPQQNVVIQTVEKIIEVPVESVKIITVEKVVEVPVEVVKYVDRLIEPDKEQQLNERKFQYQLQQSLKTQLKQAEEDKLIIQTQQAEIKRLNKDMQEKLKIEKVSSDVKSPQGLEKTDQEEQPVKEVIIEKPEQVIKEVEVIREVQVIKEIEKPVEVIKEVPYEVIKEIEVIKEVPIEIIKEVPFEVIKEVEVVKEVPIEIIKEIPIEVTKEIEVIKEVPIEIIQEIEKIVYKEGALSSNDENEKKLRQNIKELEQTIDSIKSDNEKIKASQLATQESLSSKEQEVNSLKAQIYENKKYSDDVQAKLNQDFAHNQQKISTDFKQLQAQNERMQQEHQSAINDMKRKNWWMSALQLRVKTALAKQIEKEKNSSAQMNLELQSQKSKNSEILEKLQKSGDGSFNDTQLLSQENQQLRDRIKALEKQLNESQAQKQLAIQTQNDQKLALEKIKADHLEDMTENSQKIKSMEKDFSKTVQQYEKINSENQQILKSKIQQMNQQDQNINELQEKLKVLSTDIQILSDENQKLRVQNQAPSQLPKLDLKQSEVDNNSETQLVEALKKSLKDSQKEIELLNTQISDKQKSSQEAQEKISALTDSNTDLEKASSQKDQEIQKLTNQLGLNLDQLEDHESDSHELEDKLKSLQAKLDKSQERVKHLEKEQENSKKLKIEAISIQQQIKQVNQKVSQDQKQKNQEIVQLKKQIEEDNQYNEEIRNKLQEESQQVEIKFNQSIESLTGQLTHVQTKNWWMAALQIKVRKIMIRKLEEAKQSQVNQLQQSEDNQVLQKMEKQILQKQQVMKLEILQLKRAIELKNQSVQTNQIELSTPAPKVQSRPEVVEEDSHEETENISPNTSFTKKPAPVENAPIEPKDDVKIPLKDKIQNSDDKQEKQEEIKPVIEFSNIEPPNTYEPKIIQPSSAKETKQLGEKKKDPVIVDELKPINDAIEEPKETRQCNTEMPAPNFEPLNDPLPNLKTDSTPIKAPQDFANNDLDTSIISQNNEIEDLLDNMKPQTELLPQQPSDFKIEDSISDVQNTSNLVSDQDLSISLDQDLNVKERSKTVDLKATADKKKSKFSFKQYMRNSKAFTVKLQTKFDQIWDQYDADGNAYLNKQESEKFLLQVQQIVSEDRAKNYSQEKFPQYYEQFDEDKNGVLSKGEMAMFIKVVFIASDDLSNTQQTKEDLAEDLMPNLQNSQILDLGENQLSFDLDGPTRAMSKTMPHPVMDSKKINKLKKAGEISLHKLLKKYPVKFDQDLDELWSSKDQDKNGYLDQNEAKDFVVDVSKIIGQERAKNFEKDKFQEYFEEFDEDKNGYLSKTEMAQFIKVMFKSHKNKDNQDSKVEPQPIKEQDILDLNQVEVRDDLSETQQSALPEPNIEPEQTLPFDIRGNQRNHSQTLPPERKKEKLKKSKMSFKQYMRTSKIKFNKDLDTLWDEKDDDGNGFLSIDEAKEFLVDIQKIIESERAKNFDIQELPALFKKFDEDNNGYLTKGQMAQLIKLVFNNQKDTLNAAAQQQQNSVLLDQSTDSLPFDIDRDQRDLSKTMQPVTKTKDKLQILAQKPFADYLRKYKVTFNGNLDDLWNQKDADQNGFLCMDEAKQFLLGVQKVIQQDRAKNLDLEKFAKEFEEFDEDKNGYLTKQEMSLFIKKSFKDKK